MIDRDAPLQEGIQAASKLAKGFGNPYDVEVDEHKVEEKDVLVGDDGIWVPAWVFVPYNEES